MVTYLFARLRLIVALAAIVPLLATASARDLPWRNWVHVRSLQQLATCAGASLLASRAYAIWAGVAGKQPTCTITPGPGADPAFTAYAAWLNGGYMATAQLLQMQPAARRAIFSWRNRSQASLPAAHLAVEAWRRRQWQLAIRLADAAMMDLTQEAVDILISGIAPQQQEEFPRFEYIRKQIARNMPDDVRNYMDWFEVAVHYQQWSSAAQACDAMRRHARSIGQSEAAVCHARLAFYRKDYAGAYAELKHILNDKPQDRLVWLWLGVNAKVLKKYDEAETAFLQAIVYERDPDALLNLYWQLGDCQRALGKSELARQSYYTALRYDRAGRHQRELERRLEQVQ
jgi:predicted negative regulator of RcsB-dependent stress response